MTEPSHLRASAPPRPRPYTDPVTGTDDFLRRDAPDQDDLQSRLESLSAALETTADVRARMSTNTELDQLLLQLQRLTALLATREQVAHVDAADQIAVRIALQTLSAVAVHLRRQLMAADPLLLAARDAIRKARRAATVAASGTHVRAAPPVTSLHHD